MQSFADIIKDSPSVGDVHVSSTMGQSRRRRRGQLPIVQYTQTVGKSDSTVTFYVPILKVNDELKTVYGWASVNTVGGQLVTDHQHDQVSDAEIIKAAHEFITSSRVGGVLHAPGFQGGDVVESMVLTPDVQKALGIDLGQTGWFIGYRVDDPDAWTLVKSGVLKAFSIGGKAIRVPQ